MVSQFVSVRTKTTKKCFAGHMQILLPLILHVTLSQIQSPEVTKAYFTRCTCLLCLDRVKKELKACFSLL
jgi:hypothetical protein